MKKSVRPTPRHPLTLYHASCPMESVHPDFLGPLPRTKAGNEHVLMIVDQFSKWVECLPLPSQTAKVTASAVVREFFSRFGCPVQI
ncbi:Pol polyprotein [Plakobranchus ocellatus]|uniref:Pol polyprotein n=1 Tax=Plakobranchus ocellatus TaxID=259542 RepID=A0AAV4ATR4_9GAST|nr:Pol polyprotein [Plakobranchus ocellatus]